MDRRSAVSKRSRSLAKLTRPCIYDAYPRERLFRILDESRASPVVWITGSPGSGKTVLAASWLEDRDVPGIWYQLDPGDADPATFFYYLKQAAATTQASRKATLPLLTAEYRDDVTGFARRWFRELFAHLPDGAVLALDNYQDVAGDSLLHGALAVACDELPSGAQLLVMSWGEAPPELARAAASDRLMRIGPEALRLTAEDAAGIAAGKDALVPDQIRQLHAASGGWAAGFTLLRERTRRTGLVNRIDERATMQSVFDYFIALVFRDLPQASRDTLIGTAMLPRFTDAMAIELTGTPAAAELVDALYRRHLFVERRYGEEITYQYHALFRAFLLDQARRSQPAEALAELSLRAATLLERSGSPEDAVQLLLDAGDHGSAAALLLKLAPALVAAGRGAVFREWLAKVPDTEIAARPLLSYWLGNSLMGVSSPGARAAYERAYAGVVRDRDRTGQALAIAGLLQTYLHARDDDLTAVKRWLAAIEPLFADAPPFPSSTLAARVYGSLVGAMFWLAPDHALLPMCVRHLESLLAEPLEDDVKVTAAGLLAEYYAWAGFVLDADRLISASEPLARRPGVSPMAHTYWLIRTARRDWAAGDFPKVHEKMEEAIRIAEQHNRGPGGYIAAILLGEASLDFDAERVPALVARAPTLVPTYVDPAAGKKVGTAASEALRGKYAALRGRLDDAVRHLEQACSFVSPGHVHFRLPHVLGFVSVLVERGDVEAARTVLDANPLRYPSDRFPWQAFRHAALDAIVCAAAGDASRAIALGDALQQLQALGVENPLAGQPLASRQLAELLVRHRIELPYVHRWIRRSSMVPSTPDLPEWPWRLRARTLGTFQVEVDGAPLAFAGKVPRKPLELLQAIIAFGGSDVRPETLCDALWPDSDGDSSAAAFRITLSRLRKLLKHDAVVRHEGRISLDPRLCWIDLWCFRKVCADIKAGPRDGAATRLLDVYRGAFLANERDAPWMLRSRDEHRREFAAAVAILEERLEREGRAADAAALRRDALQRDRLAMTQ